MQSRKFQSLVSKIWVSVHYIRLPVTSCWSENVGVNPSCVVFLQQWYENVPYLRSLAL